MKSLSLGEMRALIAADPFDTVANTEDWLSARDKLLNEIGSNVQSDSGRAMEPEGVPVSDKDRWALELTKDSKGYTFFGDQLDDLIKALGELRFKFGYKPVCAYRIPHGMNNSYHEWQGKPEQYGLDGEPYHPPGWPV